MNFQSVDAVLGQQDEKGYQIRVAMRATVGQIFPSEFNKKGKKTQNIFLTDGVGIEHKVKIYIGNNPDINSGDSGEFIVGPNPYENKMYYSGFIQGQLQAGQQQAPQQQGNQAGYQPQQQRPPQNNVQDDIRFAQALNRACEEYNHGKIEETAIDERTNVYYRILQNRVFPMRMKHGHQQEQQQAPQQQPASNYGVAPELDDDLAF